jgi:hypothetical protein
MLFVSLMPVILLLIPLVPLTPARAPLADNCLQTPHPVQVSLPNGQDDVLEDAPVPDDALALFPAALNSTVSTPEVLDTLVCSPTELVPVEYKF